MSFFDNFSRNRGGLKQEQSAMMPVQKSPHMMHPLNAPPTMPMGKDGQLVFPENFHDYQYVGPTVEMVPKEITLGVNRRPAVVGSFALTAQTGEVTVQEHMTATPADLKAYHMQMMLEGKTAEAEKVARLAHQTIHGVPGNAAKGIKERPGLVSYYAKAIAPIQQEPIVTKGNTLVDENGKFKPLEAGHQAPMQTAKSTNQSPKTNVAAANPGQALFMKLNSSALG